MSLIQTARELRARGGWVVYRYSVSVTRLYADLVEPVAWLEKDEVIFDILPRLHRDVGDWRGERRVAFTPTRVEEVKNIDLHRLVRRIDNERRTAEALAVIAGIS